jgi:hypothetical protein
MYSPPPPPLQFVLYAPHAARTRTRAAAVGCQRLTAELLHGHNNTLNVTHSNPGLKMSNVTQGFIFVASITTCKWFQQYISKYES